MPNRFLRQFKRRIRRKYEDINPEDIFLDSANLPGFDEYAFEGRIEQPIGRTTFIMVKGTVGLVVLALVFQLWALAVKEGDVYANISENNRLEQTLIFANRGVIYDRNMVELATNAVREDNNTYANRVYSEYSGVSHVVGYVKYPKQDKNGFYYEKNYQGVDGAERIYNEVLGGVNGIKLTETDVLGEITSESVVDNPEDGRPLVLSIDAKLSDRLYSAMENFASSHGFQGGAGVVMDIENGEILALSSFPEYDESLLVSGGDSGVITALLNSPSKPFLNRAVGGLYTPGSIIKPIIALAALHEGIISPSKEILSTGSITVPNPYDPSKPSVFGDWKAHGWTDMREAIAVSSDTYFYSIGGGFGDQKGLGISKIDHYLSLFGLAEPTGIELGGEVVGIIPTPEWKSEHFGGDIWRLGDTYITSIGQFGTQVTPLEAVRFVSAIANRGKLMEPTLLKYSEPQIYRSLDFKPEDWQVVHDGMRECVTYGSCVALNVPYVGIAAKTGTAEIGSAKKYVHSWSIGFWPYDNPRYAFALVMEKGPSDNLFGATGIMRQVFDWMQVNAPGYLE